MSVPMTALEFYLHVFIAAVTMIHITMSEDPTDEDRNKVEELFKKTHPQYQSLDSSAWDLADKITEEKLEKACRDVEVAINPSLLTTYVPTSRDKPVKEQRVIFRAPIIFRVGGEQTYHAKLINCTFAEMQFYLAQGNDENHVFCLEKDSKEDGKFRFRSGLHEINKSGFAD